MSQEDIATLRREHGEIKKILSEVQKTTAFYQTHFGMADQILTAVKKGHAKSPSMTPEFLRDKQYLQTLRNLAVQTVYSKWNAKHQPSSLLEIYYGVLDKINEMVRDHQWNRQAWRIPGRKTVDRRTEETADNTHWEKNPPCLCIRSGLYMPNPALFEEPIRTQILEIARNWRKP